MKKPAATWRMTDEIAEKILKLEGHFRLRRFKRGDQIYRQGETSSCFYFVKSGLIQVSIFRHDGSDVILENMGANSLCGEGAAFDGLPRFSTATTLEDATVLEIDADHLAPIVASDPEILRDLLRLTSAKQRILAVRLEHLVAPDPAERVLELLQRLGDLFGANHRLGRKILTHLTHEQIASMTGTSRVTVTRTLGRLREKGAVTIEDGYIVLSSHQS